MMNTPQDTNFTQPDPLGLRELPMLDPPRDGWPDIETALLARSRAARRMGWLSAAASLLIVAGIVTLLKNPEMVPTNQPEAEVTTALTTEPVAAGEETLDGLIAMSQTLEQQVRGLRNSAGSMPASSAVYVAELEDLVAQVDNELSFSPDSVNLWGQRVNLLLDLAQLYQHHWEREYGRMASL